MDQRDEHGSAHFRWVGIYAAGVARPRGGSGQALYAADLRKAAPSLGEPRRVREFKSHPARLPTRRFHLRHVGIGSPAAVNAHNDRTVHVATQAIRSDAQSWGPAGQRFPAPARRDNPHAQRGWARSTCARRERESKSDPAGLTHPSPLRGKNEDAQKPSCSPPPARTSSNQPIDLTPVATPRYVDALVFPRTRADRLRYHVVREK